jgi:hypothetical protein
MKLPSRALALLFVALAGLFGPRVHAEPPPPSVATLVHAFDRTHDRVQMLVDAQQERSTRAIATALPQLPTISLAHKQAVIACIDHHLACTRLDLVAAIEARDQAIDDRLATLADVEIGEYRATHARLLALRRLIAA